MDLRKCVSEVARLNNTYSTLKSLPQRLLATSINERMTTVTVVALLQKFNLKDSDLDLEIARGQFMEVSHCLTEWKLLALNLPEFEDCEIDDIESDNKSEEGKRLSFLKKLKQKLSINVTYRLLVNKLLTIGRAEDARRLCTQLTGKQ